MASIKISGLTEQTTASDTDLLPVASSAGMAKRMTLANFVTWLRSKLGIDELNSKIKSVIDGTTPIAFTPSGAVSLRGEDFYYITGNRIDVTFCHFAVFPEADEKHVIHDFSAIFKPHVRTPTVGFALNGERINVFFDTDGLLWFDAPSTSHGGENTAIYGQITAFK